jgi:hypothetical protein
MAEIHDKRGRHPIQDIHRFHRLGVAYTQTLVSTWQIDWEQVVTWLCWNLILTIWWVGNFWVVGFFLGWYEWPFSTSTNKSSGGTAKTEADVAASKEPTDNAVITEASTSKEVIKAEIDKQAPNVAASHGSKVSSKVVEDIQPVNGAVVSDDYTDEDAESVEEDQSRCVCQSMTQKGQPCKNPAKKFVLGTFCSKHHPEKKKKQKRRSLRVSFLKESDE